MKKEQSHGEKLMGVSFNPSQQLDVRTVKEGFAVMIDYLLAVQKDSNSPVQRKLIDLAIDGMISDQMMAVKALTWKD